MRSSISNEMKIKLKILKKKFLYFYFILVITRRGYVFYK